MASQSTGVQNGVELDAVGGAASSRGGDLGGTDAVTRAFSDVGVNDDDQEAQGSGPQGEGDGDAALSARMERESLLSDQDRERLRETSRRAKAQGNEQFGQEFWSKAAQLYTEALDTCPLSYSSDRALFYSNRAAANMKLEDWNAAIDDCTEAINLGAPNEKPLERRAHSYAQIEEKYEKAIDDYETLLRAHPDGVAYREKIASLRELIEKRNEKFKQDALSKLKELGNICLRPFGLSTDNFEMVQQPGGGYSINMKK